jgi:hypothetical protein
VVVAAVVVVVVVVVEEEQQEGWSASPSVVAEVEREREMGEVSFCPRAIT